MAKLASLVVDLQLQSAQLRQGLDEANRKLDDFGKQAEKTADVVAGAFAWDEVKDSLKEFRDWLKSGADAADQMGDLAQSVGVPVEALSKLSYAALFSGSSTEAVGKALAKTADLMRKAAEPTSEQAAMFKALGVAVSGADDKLRATEDVFADIAQRFAETEDGTAKTALAIRLFGDEGTKLVPLLNNGKAGLASFAAEAERTGNVITQKGADSAGEFNDALDRLKKSGEGLALRVAQDLTPSMAAFAESLTSSKAGTEAFDTAAQGLAGTLRVLASAGVIVASTFETVGVLLAGVASAAVSAAQGDFRAAQESLKAEGQELLSTLTAEGKRLNAIWTTSGPGAAMAKDAEKAKPSADEYVNAIDKAKKAAEKAAEAQKKLAADTKKAMEDSSKAMDDFVKSALALDRKHAEIARATARRRAEAEGASPTGGFTGLEDALSKMEEAQRAEATLLDQANIRDKAGDIIGADSALRKAAELSELADRASAAVDAFRDLGKEAEDAAAKALEAQVEASAALEQVFDSIDRDVAARREAVQSPNRDPTSGFASFNAALDSMAMSLKREAELRAEVGALERAGKLGEARQVMLAAEAAKALAEQSSAAADALAAMDRAAADVPKQLGGMLASGLGSTTSALLQGVETGAAGGPVGAVAGAVVGLLSQSESFQALLAEVESILQALADSLGKLVEPLMPLLYVVSEVAAGLGVLFEALSPIVEFVVRPLFEVLKLFGVAVLELIHMVGTIINSFVEFFGGEGFDLSGIDKALARLASASYDSAREQRKVAETAREMAAGLANVPSWWKVDLARFNAADPSVSGGTVINDNSSTTIQVSGADDPEAVAEMILDRIEEKKNRRTGSKYGDDLWVP